MQLPTPTLTKEEIVNGLAQYRTKIDGYLQANTAFVVVNSLKKINENARNVSQHDIEAVLRTPARDLPIIKMMDAVKQAALWYVDLLRQTQPSSSDNGDVHHCMAIVVVLTIATNLRMNELRQLTVQHLRDILDDKLVCIKIKKRNKSLRIIPNRRLLLFYLKHIENYNKLHNTKTIINYTSCYLNSIFRSKVLSLNTSLAALHNVKFGVQSLRKLNTTLLLGNFSNPKLVSYFNRHRSYETTKYYSTLYNAARDMSKVVQV